MKVVSFIFAWLLMLAWAAGVYAGDQIFTPADGASVDGASALVSPDLFKNTRLVVYDYDNNRTYPVKSRVHVYTEISVASDEHIVSWFPSADEKRGWPYTVSGDRQHVFVMPMQAGTVNSATLITDKRSYLLTFEAVNQGEWFQRVRWNVAEDSVTDLPNTYESQQPADTNADPGSARPDLENMFVDYDIKGNADFAPTLVADDGKFTWFRLSPDVQELPALFLLDKNDQAELVNYTVEQNNLLKAQRTAGAWLLKLGDEEVKVKVKSQKADTGLFGWFN